MLALVMIVETTIGVASGVYSPVQDSEPYLELIEVPVSLLFLGILLLLTRALCNLLNSLIRATRRRGS